MVREERAKITGMNGQDSMGRGELGGKTAGGDSENAWLRDKMTKPRDGPTRPPQMSPIVL